jgi:multidrug efflux system membrane fusion protein
MKWITNPRWILIAVVLVGAVFAWRAGYFGGAGTKPAESGDNGRDGGRRKNSGAIPVSVVAAHTQDVPVTLDAVGTVQALNTASIQTQVDGRLTGLPVKEGAFVKKGDLIATIEPWLYEAAYNQAVAKKAQDEATLANARIDLVRYQKLAVNNYGSQQQYVTQKYLVAQLEAQVKTDEAVIYNTKTTLDYCYIHSPIDGYVGIRAVDVGNILHASAQSGAGQIVTIAQLKPIYVFFTIPQQSLSAVQRAQANGNSKVSALEPDNVTVIETGQVEVIDQAIDQTTGTARLKAIFANPNLRLWNGEFVNVRMVVDTVKNALVVPSTAIQPGPSGPYVYLLGDGDVAKLQNVSTGFQDDHANIVVVTQGLHEADQVITSGFGRLSDGANVRVARAGQDADKPEDDAIPAGGAKSGDGLGAGPPGAGGERRHRREGRGGSAAGAAPPPGPSPAPQAAPPSGGAGAAAPEKRKSP